MLVNKTKFGKAFIGRMKAFHIHPFKELVYKVSQLSILFLPHMPYIYISIYLNTAEHKDEKTRPQTEILKPHPPKTYTERSLMFCKQ